MGDNNLDNINDFNSTPITDVAKPGSTPASPTSKPIITSNQPVTDPMMTTAEAPRNLDITATPSEALADIVSSVDQMPAGPPPPAENITPEEFADAPQAQANSAVSLSNPAVSATANSEQTAENNQNLQDHANPETGHKLIHDQATFGNVGRKKSRKLIISIVLILLLLAAAGMAYKLLIAK